jgi:hypothetical protein
MSQNAEPFSEGFKFAPNVTRVYEVVAFEKRQVQLTTKAK